MKLKLPMGKRGAEIDNPHLFIGEWRVVFKIFNNKIRTVKRLSNGQVEVDERSGRTAIFRHATTELWVKK